MQFFQKKDLRSSASIYLVYDAVYELGYFDWMIKQRYPEVTFLVQFMSDLRAFLCVKRIDIPQLWHAIHCNALGGILLQCIYESVFHSTLLKIALHCAAFFSHPILSFVFSFHFWTNKNHIFHLTGFVKPYSRGVHLFIPIFILNSSACAPFVMHYFVTLLWKMIVTYG